MSTPFSVGFCGSGKYSVQCAEALANDPRFQIIWSITPPAKPVGRKQELQQPELTLWSQQNQIPVYQVASTLNDLTTELSQAAPIDFLVVVSFGYLIPEWLLQLPRIAPINVHPSALPLYRGSSPGQYVILYGEKQSAVTIMRMNAKFDEGAIIAQLPLAVSADETQTHYYDRAFSLAQAELPNILATYAENRQEAPQPPAPAEVPLAQRFTREDGFVPYSLLTEANITEATKAQLGPALRELVARQPDLTAAQLLDRAVRALSPWPGVWTTLPEYKGKQNVRLKILQGRRQNTTYEITQWQYDGEDKKSGKFVL